MNIDLLKNVHTLITHDNCADGLASALIIKDALPDIKIRFLSYNSPEHVELKPEPGMLFCDFTPYVERAKTPEAPMTARGLEQAKAWADAGTIVLDHHRGAQDLVEMFGERGRFADEKRFPGVSGAVLANVHVWYVMREGRGRNRVMVDRLARLVGVRDTWQRDALDWENACAWSAALLFWPREVLLASDIFKLESRLEIGHALLEKNFERDTKSIAEAYRFTVKGVRVVVFDGLHTSDIADRLSGEGVPTAEYAHLVMGWHYLMEGNVPKMVVSTRSRGAFNCMEFAKVNGGGGHTKAAGFKLPVYSSAQNPYAVLEQLVVRYLDK